METMPIGEFIRRVEAADLGATKKNVMVAVRRVLRQFDHSSEFCFDARGVEILFDIFESSEKNSSQPLSSRAINNYKNLFLHAAHTVAGTKVRKQFKVTMTLDTSP
jgi:glycyl-tRNA synthetase alpha subunit